MPVWPRYRPIGIEMALAMTMAARLTSRWVLAKPQQLRRAAHLDAAAHRFALLEDELDRVAEVAEQRDRGAHEAAARCQGVVRRWTARMITSSTAASSTHRPPATTTFDLK